MLDDTSSGLSDAVASRSKKKNLILPPAPAEANFLVMLNCHAKPLHLRNQVTLIDLLTTPKFSFML